MADTEISAFLTELQKIRGTGRFCTHGSMPFVPPGIVLKNGEDLALPLGTAQAEELRSLAEQAPYGMGAETRLDVSVRKCWQIDAAELRWSSAKWQSRINALVKEAAGELGVEGEVSAQPYKLLLYDKGGFFLPHRDTEKVPGMFGSLIVCLPSRHSGGELVLRHQGREERVDLGADFDPAEIRWAAFFADCEHEVLPVTSGHRLCLAYNLVQTKKKGRQPGAPSGENEALLRGLRHIAGTLGDDLTAILLEHRYTEEGLRVAALKGDDRARATALFATAEKAGLTARLALVSLYQMGQLEEEDYYSSRHRRGRNSSPEEEGEMGEIFEESLTITHWRTPEDKKEGLGIFSISEDKILSLAALDDGKPDEKYAEGYTGNAGCTMEHWYRRAAIVVWHQNATPALLARYDFDAACENFRTMAGKKKGNEQTAIICRALLKEGAIRLGKAAGYEADYLGARMSPLLCGIGRLGDEALYEKLANAAFLPAFKNASRDTWTALLGGFAGRPLDFFLRHTPDGSVSFNRQAWFKALDATLGHAEELLPFFAELLPRLAVEDDSRSYRGYDPDEGRFSKPDHQAHLALAASCVLVKNTIRQKLRDWLWKDGALLHLREVLAPALMEKTHQRWFGKENSLAPDLLAAAIEALAAETARPLPPYPDWKRPAPTSSSPDALIQALLRFMADPAAERHEIRSIQSDRQRVEQYVEHHQLDLDLTTVRKGSPHTLVCCKNDHSHRRALKQRAEDETLLAKLRKHCDAPERKGSP